MALDYEIIKSENQKRYGTDIGRIGPLFFTDTYADRTHFIFELLQNTEDALYRRGSGWDGIRSVSFRLAQDQLRVSHFGDPFNEDDVRGICGIAKSSKSESLTEIGRFGIGFKSVYAFTNRPEIHSGTEDFAVENYVWPVAESEIAGRDTDETVIVLPLKSGSHAIIANGLKSLGIRALLFLRQIEEIAWEIEGGESGQYLRESERIDDGVRRVSVIGRGGLGNEFYEEWLVFSRQVDNDGMPAGHVEIAFLENQNSGAIQAVGDSRLVAFFPTKIDVKVGFLVQGPYRTTPSRDTVPLHDPWNKRLIDETAALLVKTLTWLRDRKRLDANTLQCMPLKEETIGVRFGDTFHKHRPNDSVLCNSLFDAAKEAFRSDALLPGLRGGYLSVKQALIGRGNELRELFSSDQLSDLYDAAGIDWLSGDITQDRTPNLHRYLIDELGVREIAPESIIPTLGNEFLEAQSDEWIIKLYRFLNLRGAVKRASYRAPIIRLENGEHVSVNASGRIRLPSESKTDFPTVRSTICADTEALAFLKSLGLREPDLVDDVIRHVLPKYVSGQTEVDNSDYVADIRRVLSAYNTDSTIQRATLVRNLALSRFVKAVDAGTGEELWSTPGDVYLRTGCLPILFEDVAGVHFVNNLCEPLQTEMARVMLEKCGATSYLKRVEVPGAIWSRFTWSKLQEMRSGERSTRPSEETVQDWTIPGLKQLLDTLPTLNESARAKRARLLYDALAEYANHHPGSEAFSGSYSWFYYSRKIRRFPANFVELLNNAPWVPDSNGELQLPKDVQFDTLGWEENPILQSQIHFKPPKPPRQPVVNDLAKAAGVEPEMIDFIKERRITVSELRELYGSRSNSPEGSSGIRSGDAAPVGATSGGTRSDDNGSVTKSALTPQSFADKLFGVQTANPRVAPDSPVIISEGGPRTEESAASDTRKSNEYGRQGAEVQKSVTRWEPVEAAKELADKFRSMAQSDYDRRCQICGAKFMMRNGESQIFVVHVVPPSADYRTNHFGDLLGLCGRHYALIRYCDWTLLDPGTGAPSIDSDNMRRTILAAPEKMDDDGNSYVSISIRFWNLYEGWGSTPSHVDEEIRYSKPHWEYLKKLMST